MGVGGLRNEGHSWGGKNGELLPPNCTQRTTYEIFLLKSCPILSNWTILPAIEDTANHAKQAFKFKEIALKDKLHCPQKGFCCVLMTHCETVH